MKLEQWLVMRSQCSCFFCRDIYSTVTHRIERTWPMFIRPPFANPETFQRKQEWRLALPLTHHPKQNCVTRAMLSRIDRVLDYLSVSEKFE